MTEQKLWRFADPCLDPWHWSLCYLCILSQYKSVKSRWIKFLLCQHAPIHLLCQYCAKLKHTSSICRIYVLTETAAAWFTAYVCYMPLQAPTATSYTIPAASSCSCSRASKATFGMAAPSLSLETCQFGILRCFASQASSLIALFSALQLP